MANVVKNGITVTPGSGSGNTALKVSATPNRGNRLTQSATFKVATPGDGPSAQFTANHVAAEEFITPASLTPAVPKDGGQITISGTSNSPKLTFAPGAGSIIDGEITTYQANGSSATSGQEISGDPGAAATFNWSVTINTTENPTVEERTQTIVISGDGADPVTVTLTQAVGDAELSLDPNTVNIPQAGTEQTVQVTTNTTFTVTAV